jgi:putative endonuclease
MAGLVPAIPTGIMLRFHDRDHRHKAGDDEVGSGNAGGLRHPLALATQAAQFHVMRLYYVYILASRPGGALYVGVTNDLSRRVWEHKTGKGGEHTRRYGIDRLVFYESYPSISDAIQRETSIKRWPRAWKTNLILSMNPTWRDLYEELNA